MADVLDQAEVDALLAAVDAGQLDDVSQQTRRSAGLPKDVRTYDFKRPERVSKDQMRSLEGIHEGFARNLGASLSGFLRTIIEVRVATTEQLTYSEFIHSLPNPTNFNLLNCEPLEGQMCLEMSPLIIYPIIDRLLGGSNAELFIPQRPLTMIELRLVGRITDRALQSLTEVWSNLVDVTFSLAEVESNPHLVQIVAPNEVVVVIGFEIKMGARAGTMSLCIPFNVIEPMIDDLSAQSWFLAGRLHADNRWGSMIARRLSEARLEVAGLLAETTITLAELRGLEVGDLITTEKPSTAPIVLTADGHPKFFAHLGQHKGNRALRIVRPIESSDRL